MKDDSSEQFIFGSVVAVALALARYVEIYPILVELDQQEGETFLPDELQEESRQITLALVAFARSMAEIKEEFTSIPDSPLVLLPLISDLVHNYSLLALPRGSDEVYLRLLSSPDALTENLTKDAKNCLNRYGRDEAVDILRKALA